MSAMKQHVRAWSVLSQCNGIINEKWERNSFIIFVSNKRGKGHIGVKGYEQCIFTHA